MIKTIYLAGGCFWGVEAYFKRLKGVLETSVGYANGNTMNPKYEDLKAGKATHAETVQIKYDSLYHFCSKVIRPLPSVHSTVAREPDRIVQIGAT